MAHDPYKYFRIESREPLDELGRGVLALEKHASPEIVQRLLRLAHTLKGAARVVRQPEIADRAHEIEDELAPFRNGVTALARDQITKLLALLDDVAQRLGALAVPADPDAAAAKAVVHDDPVRWGHADLAEMDSLLEGVLETHARLGTVRSATADLERARRLSEVVVAHLAPRGAHDRARAGSDLDKTHALAELLRDALQRCERQLGAGLEHVDRELAQVRDVTESLRLVPIESCFTSLERTARDAAHATGKRATFEGSGGSVRLDAQIFVAVQRALVQLVRNAVAHGIESEADRLASRKPAEGRVTLEVLRRGHRVAFTCRDDGRGIDLEAVRRISIARGQPMPVSLTSGTAELSSWLLRGGMSTAKDVTEVAGRGVGLDVVREVTERLGGEIAVHTEANVGTRFELVVPVSLAAVEVLVAESSGVIVAIPLHAVRQTLRIASGEISHTARDESFVHDGKATAIVRLDTILGTTTTPARGRVRVAMIVEGASGTAAIGIDHLLGTASIVVRPIPELAAVDPVIAGASLDGSGNPQLVLDPDHLVLAARQDRGPECDPAIARHSVLVIDDSLTTRMLEQSILESAGYDVDTAMSGEHALEAARHKRYALFLVDVEMPGIDGFTFVERVRADPALRATPAILVTSRDSPEDRIRGSAVGAQGYIVKSEFDQVDLLARIQRIVGTI